MPSAEDVKDIVHLQFLNLIKKFAPREGVFKM